MAARLAPYLLPLAAGAVVGLALACLLAPIRWDDQSFYIYAAPHLLDGYRLYSPDLQDTNPPLIAWMTMIPALLARLSGLSLETSFILFVALMACIAIAWSLRLAAKPGQPATPAASAFLVWLAVALVYATVILPNVKWKLDQAFDAFGMALRYDFGQREHLLSLLVLPYLFAAARRVDGRRVSAAEGALIGVVAALGFCLKPQYLTVAAAVEALVALRARSLSALVRPEVVALVVTGLGYCAAVWIITPQYFTEVIPVVATVYGDFSRKTAWEVMTASKVHFAVVAAGVLALVLAGRSDAKHRASVFLAAGAAAFVSFLLQGKGWSDHLLPAETFVVVALALSAFGWLLQRRRHDGDTPERVAPRRAALATTAALAGAVVFGLCFPAREALWADSDYARQLAEAEDATTGFPPGTAFVTLADGIYSQFDFALDRGFVWASRYPFLLLPPRIIRESADPPATVRSAGYFLIPDLLGTRGAGPDPRAYAAMLRAHVTEDFSRWRPAVVFVQRCDDPVAEPCTFGAGFRIVDWLSADPAFAALWSNYRFSRRVERFDMFVATERTAR
ncbi:MAG: hypothetical protein ACM30I_10455 [Gemmatimonas sp.]